MCRAVFYYKKPQAAKTKASAKRLSGRSDTADGGASRPKLDWPTSGWSVKSEDLPVINSCHILDHLVKTGKAVPGEDTVVVAQKPLRRG